MKKLLILSLIFAAMLGLCACGDADIASTTPSGVIQATFGKTESATDGTQQTTLPAPTNASTTTPSTEGTTVPITEPTDPVTEPPHTHSYRPATCTAPKVCSCGVTEGKANGHNWKEATCSEPKTCTVCGATSGLTAGHTFSGGKCTTCGKADPDQNHTTMVWIPTKGGTKYHTKAGCSNMDNPEQVALSEAESRGFTPCKKCH